MILTGRAGGGRKRAPDRAAGPSEIATHLRNGPGPPTTFRSVRDRYIQLHGAVVDRFPAVSAGPLNLPIGLVGFFLGYNDMTEHAAAGDSGETETSASRGSLLVVFLTVFVDLLGFGIVLPLLPIYGRQFAEAYGLSDAQQGWTVGALMSSFSAMQFLFLPIWGRLSDRYGRRPILMIGLAGSTFFYGMFGLATMWQSLVGLFIARIGAGIAGATISTAQAYIADTTSKKNRAKGMALIGAAFALGFTLGPMIGAVALFGGDSANLSPWPGYVASALSGVALLLAIFLLPESLQKHDSSDEHAETHWLNRSGLHVAMGIPSVALLLLTSFIAVFSFANFESTLSLQIEQIAAERSAQQSTLTAWVERIHDWGYQDPADVKLVIVFAVFAYLGFVLTLAQGFLVRRLSSRLSETAMAVMGGLLALIGFVLLARAAAGDNFGMLLWALPIEVIGFAFVSPSLQSLISRRSPPQHQGAVLGLGQSATSLARILGPVFGIRLFAAAPAWPYWAAAALMVLGLLLVVVASRRGRDYSDASGAP